MGKVKYATGIDHVSGSLAKPKVKDGHSCGTYLIGTHRVAPTQNPDCTRLFIREADTYKRTTPVTALETKARSRFAAVRAAVAERAGDLSKMSADQLAFEAQKNLADGKKTMQAYLWKICGEAYDQEHQG
ncbi:MAG: hypothetical protein IKP57_04070 [Paludibacteraceae bacterium]|nr:hypothetical protein [Paludibacteraceae bacterium]